MSAEIDIDELMNSINSNFDINTELAQTETIPQINHFHTLVQLPATTEIENQDIKEQF